jgi:hypothetical protein
VDASSLRAWNPPAPWGGVGTCSSADLTTIHASLATPDASVVDLYAALQGPDAAWSQCLTCIFSSASDSWWQLVVWDPDPQSGNAFLNPGACYAAALNAKTACGEAVAQESFCLSAACPSATCGSLVDCRTTATSSACASEHARTLATCGGDKSTLDTLCVDLEAQIRAVCGGALPDGGSFMVPPPPEASGASDGRDTSPFGPVGNGGCATSEGTLDVLSLLFAPLALMAFAARRRRGRR